MRPASVPLVRLRPSMLACLVSAALVGLPVQAAESGTSLTVYSSMAAGTPRPDLSRTGGRGDAVPGYAIVRQDRDVQLAEGRNTVRIVDVAALIDPTTVTFQSLTDPKSATVLEQNFQFDLVSQEKLLQRYLDRSVTVDQVRGDGVVSFNGTLLSTTGGIVIRTPDGSVQTLNGNSGVRLPELPGGLITRPTLVWDVQSSRAGNHRTRISYETRGVTWWADYNVTYAEAPGSGACRLDIGSWVTLVNQSGASYTDAALKLIAGDVQRVTPRPRQAAPAAARAMTSEMRTDGFQEKAFFEYHLYTLGRNTTLPDNSTKQIELFPAARGVACEKMLVFSVDSPVYGGGPYTDRGFGTQQPGKTAVYLEFRNASDNNMGMPLPAGRMRVSKEDPADKSLEFVGEDAIGHTPRNEKVRIGVGSSFDVVGERRQVSFNVDSSRRMITEEIEVRVRNQKKEPAAVAVRENLYRWTNWQITQKSHDYQKLDARTMQFPVKLAAGAEAVVRYTVQYTW